MPAKLKHLAIVSDQYTLLERFYGAMFGMKPSPDNPPAGAVVVSDGYVGLNINPRKGKAAAKQDWITSDLRWRMSKVSWQKCEKNILRSTY